MTHPFYTTSDNNGIGIIVDGTIGFDLGTTKFNTPDGDKVCHSLRIYPLDHKQKPGHFDDTNHICTDTRYSEIAFGSIKSIDVFIDTLNKFKNIIASTDYGNV